MENKSDHPYTVTPFGFKTRGIKYSVLNKNNGICVIKMSVSTKTARGYNSSSCAIERGKYSQVLHKNRWNKMTLYLWIKKSFMVCGLVAAKIGHFLVSALRVFHAFEHGSIGFAKWDLQ